MKNIGFVGLGLMGCSMAKNLISAGFKLHVVKGRAKKAVAEVSKLGAKLHSTPKAVAAATDAVITCLPDTPDVQEVVIGNNGLLSSKKGQLIIDMSTISPTAAQEMAAICAKKGVFFIDAPISGGTEGARDATLSIMIGGKAKGVKAAMPLFQAMGKKIVHVGGPGAGQFTKATNQIIAAGTWQAIGEGLVLAAKAGLDPAKVLEAVSAGAARCWALEVRAPSILDRHFKPGFMAKLQRKDLGIALDAGRALDVPLPGTALVHQFYNALVQEGGGDLDTSALVTMMEKLANVEIKRK